MKTDYRQLLLADNSMVDLLKEMILEKANRYDMVSQQIISEKRIDDLLSGDIAPETLDRVFKNYELQEELVLLKRDLSSMCYQLNKSMQKVQENTKWEQAYNYATQVVQITDVVANLLGVTNLNKNIQCPFHEDKSPSLKIYTKNNRFVCFGCGARGSPIDFVMKHKNCSFKEAVLYLSNY